MRLRWWKTPYAPIPAITVAERAVAGGSATVTRA
jgi:hypothetical protein